MPESTIRIGILGAARIAPAAIIKPAREVEGTQVVALAARNPQRAAEFARKHGIAKVYDTYEDLLADPDIDAVYIPLPNGLHGEWTIKAMRAGKHVLCEKPSAANAEEAEEVARVAAETRQVMMEAYHWRYHALATRMREIIDSGEIGNLRHVSMSMCFPLLPAGDIRWQWSLAGGALMDCCYTVNILRFLAGSEPQVISASSRARGPKIDRYMRADLMFGDGVSGSIEASMLSSSLLKLKAVAVGDKGEMHVLNPVLPQLFHRLTVKTGNQSRKEKVQGEASYTAQLRVFAKAVREDTPVPSDAADAIRNMQVIDAIYAKAGLPRRLPSSVC